MPSYIIAKGVDHVTEHQEKQFISYVVEQMNARFDKLEQKMDLFQTDNRRENERITMNCTKKRAEIYKRIEDHKKESDDKIEENGDKIAKLDKKIFQLFFIGTGVGFLLGVATTVIVNKVMMGG